MRGVAESLKKELELIKTAKALDTAAESLEKLMRGDYGR
jgi:hypothetical protein